MVIVPSFLFNKKNDNDDDWEDIDEILHRYKKEDKLKEYEKEQIEKRRQSIRSQVKKLYSEGLLECDICLNKISTNDFSFFILGDAQKYNVFCKDCTDGFSHQLLLSYNISDYFVNLASFSKNIEKKLIEKNTELEKRIKELERKLKILQDEGEEVF